MTLETVRAVLGWGAILNLVFVSIWFFVFTFAHEWVFSLHTRWFDLPRATFDAIHYAGMAWYKLCTWMFFIIPYIILRCLI